MQKEVARTAAGFVIAIALFGSIFAYLLASGGLSFLFKRSTIEVRVWYVEAINTVGDVWEYKVVFIVDIYMDLQPKQDEDNVFRLEYSADFNLDFMQAISKEIGRPYQIQRIGFTGFTIDFTAFCQFLTYPTIFWKWQLGMTLDPNIYPTHWAYDEGHFYIVGTSKQIQDSLSSVIEIVTSSNVIFCKFTFWMWSSKYFEARLNSFIISTHVYVVVE